MEGRDLFIIDVGWEVYTGRNLSRREGHVEGRHQGLPGAAAVKAAGSGCISQRCSEMGGWLWAQYSCCLLRTVLGLGN